VRVETVADLLQRSGLPSIEARALLAQQLGVPREMLVAHPERSVDDVVAVQFAALAARRRLGEPLAYLLGEREFYGRVFQLTLDVLVPRPETELLVELALSRAASVRAPAILDLGTGSGCIAITVALERPDARVTAVDISAAALTVARNNSTRLGARVTFTQGDWFATMSRRFDLIVANPPYVAEGDPHLEALRHEPRGALVAARNGLACLSAIIRGARPYLATNGWLLLEHGYDQAAAVRDLLIGAGFTAVSSHLDAANVERVSAGRLSEERASEASRVAP
jgi:release factor glutamine methyltransferase